jgi:Lipase (class 3)
LIPTDLDLARFVNATYDTAPAGEVYDVGPDRAIITRFSDCTLIAIRGTDNPAGWWSDFRINGGKAKDHPQLGTCEEGFLTGAEALWAVLQPKLGLLPVVVACHSRGSGMGPIIVGFMLLAGVQIARVVLFEKPWCCGPQLRGMIAAAKIDGLEYWNGDDPVPLVPSVPWLCMNVWAIQHVGKWAIDPIDCHFMVNVVGALAEAA